MVNVSTAQPYEVFNALRTQLVADTDTRQKNADIDDGEHFANASIDREHIVYQCSRRSVIDFVEAAAVEAGTTWTRGRYDADEDLPESWLIRIKV